MQCFVSLHLEEKVFYNLYQTVEQNFVANYILCMTEKTKVKLHDSIYLAGAVYSLFLSIIIICKLI